MHLLHRFTDQLALIWWLAIVYLTLTPEPVLPAIPVSDKVEHFAAYMLLSYLATYQRTRLTGILLLALLIILFGGTMELLQPYLNRSRELGDFLANTGGVCAGVALMWLSRTLFISDDISTTGSP